MSEINRHTGNQIRMYRKAQGLTLQQLADLIHKSRATVSKYENGEITLDVETLYDICQVLHVSTSQILDFNMKSEIVEEEPPAPAVTGKSAFFEAERLYFYFYDGRQKRLKNGIIDIHKSKAHPSGCDASFCINSVKPNGRSGAFYYTGKVIYSDMLIRFSFENKYNSLEEDLLYIFNPLEMRDTTEGLLCGISSADLMPCAYKCLVTLNPQEPTEELIRQLMFTKKEIQLWQKLNMLIVDNQG